MKPHNEYRLYVEFHNFYYRFTLYFHYTTLNLPKLSYSFKVRHTSYIYYMIAVTVRLKVYYLVNDLMIKKMDKNMINSYPAML